MEQRSFETTYEAGEKSLRLEIEVELVWHGAYAECDDLSVSVEGQPVPFNFRARLWNAIGFGFNDNEHFTKFINDEVDRFVETAARD